MDTKADEVDFTPRAKRIIEIVEENLKDGTKLCRHGTYITFTYERNRQCSCKNINRCKYRSTKNICRFIKIT